VRSRTDGGQAAAVTLSTLPGGFVANRTRPKPAFRQVLLAQQLHLNLDQEAASFDHVVWHELDV